VKEQEAGVDIVDIFEEMLCHRAMKGFRPVLYVSSFTDLECNMLMLLDETAEWCRGGQAKPVEYGAGYQVTMN
jgi:hypothetical protein